MIHEVRQLVWGPWLLAAFLAAGIIFTMRLRFFQILHLRRWLRETAGRLMGNGSPGERSGRGGNRAGQGEGEGGGDGSQFLSVCTALAATVGTGNIVGVATAITSGGAGALFWMWVSAFLGMATAYGETYLGVKFSGAGARGRMLSGPMAYMERGLKKPWMAAVYSLCCVLSSLGMGSMVQANSIAESVGYVFSVDRRLAGMALAAAVMAVTAGGARRIVSMAGRLVPISAGLYMSACLVIIFSCLGQVPAVLGRVFEGAFGIRAAAGGAAGYGISRAIQYGLSRGVFSNEAGLGSLALLNGASEAGGEGAPERQGMWAMFEVFFDTILSCTLTALVILCTAEKFGALPELLDGGALTAHCFSVYFGMWGERLVAVSMVLFAFSTIIAWFYLGLKSLDYLTGSRAAVYVYAFLYLHAVAFGCFFSLKPVWELSDILNGLMAVPNLAAVLLLRKMVCLPGSGAETRKAGQARGK